MYIHYITVPYASDRAVEERYVRVADVAQDAQLVPHPRAVEGSGLLPGRIDTYIYIYIYIEIDRSIIYIYIYICIHTHIQHT